MVQGGQLAGQRDTQAGILGLDRPAEGCWREWVTVPPRVRAEDELIEARFRVAEEHAGIRLDVFLQQRIKRVSRNRVQAILESQEDQSAFLRPARRVRAGEQIVLKRRPPSEPEVPRCYGVLHEDAQVLGIDKPAGLPVHPTARYHDNTLTSLLRQQHGPRTYFAMAHRLDRETSGVLLVAKVREAGVELKRQFADREVSKEYLAIVEGHVEDDSGCVELPLRLSSSSRVRVRMEVAPAGVTALPAVTRYRVLGRRIAAGRGPISLLAITPLTGRQHQIRVHLAAIGHPIVGDKIYAYDERLFMQFCDHGWSDDLAAVLGLPRHALHAYRLCTRHPGTGQPFEMCAPLPEDLVQFWLSASEN
jgi:23S rRNA pseudouridine1911/1915/1917 synthase